MALDCCARLLRSLSVELTAEYGVGFSVSALQYMRGFYLAFPNLLSLDEIPPQRGQQHPTIDSLEIQHALRVISTVQAQQEWKPGRLHPSLSWTHYRTLLKVTRQPVRDFYEIEAVRNDWSARQLERQISSLLFERLLKSRDKAGVMALSTEGVVANSPVDVIKDPYVLEFLDSPSRTVLSNRESKRLSSPSYKHFCLSSAVASHSSDVRFDSPWTATISILT